MAGETVVARRVADPDAGVPQPGSDATGTVAGAVTAPVVAFRAWLASVDVGGLSDADRVDLVAELERVKGSASAVQARATDALRCSREAAAPAGCGAVGGFAGGVGAAGVPGPGGPVRGVVAGVGARDAGDDGRPGHRGDLRAARGGGGAGHRRLVPGGPGRGGPPGRSGAGPARGPGAGRAAARVAAELDAASVVARMEAAVASRRVTVRPAPDGMAYLSVLGPLTEVVGAHAALLARSRAVLAGQCPDEAPDGRGAGAVAADTALRLLSGRAVGTCSRWRCTW